MKVVHIITGLGLGGAETMLFKLLSQMDRDIFAPEVISLTDVGPVGERIREIGIPVHSVGFKSGMPTPGAYVRLTGLLGSLKPDVVQTWMYHADLLGGLAAKQKGIKAVAWNIRNSTLDRNTSKRSTILVMKMCARLSRRLPARIVCCSETAKQVHIAQGYTPEKFQIIPNGFDLAAFRPDASARVAVREELRLPQDTLLVGLVGRYNPQKDHASFVQAAARTARHHPNVHFLLCGEHVTLENGEVAAQIEATGLAARFHLLGRRTDIARLNAAFDVAASSSAYGEAFSNVLGEAMACGVPCVATDVGDAGLIIGETGRVVPPRSPDALAEGLLALLCMDADQRVALGQKARYRVQENFSLPLIAAHYQQLYQELAPCAA